MRYHAGILDGRPEWDRAQVLILGHTPGVPLEWIYAALDIKEVRRRHLRDMLAATREGEWVDMGRENAASITQADGWAMLEVVCPGYSGPVPLASQLALQGDHRSDQAMADALGVDRQKVRRWRVNAVFDPLTGVRLRPNRGVSLLKI